jgi:hypothetical protein
MVCESEKAEQFGRQLWDQKMGCLMTCRRVKDMMLNCPTSQVALVIMAEEDAPADTQRALSRLRHRWPGCPMIVVGGIGGVEHEMAARQGGAFYLAPGEAAQQLPDMVSHVLRAHARGEAGSSALVERRHPVPALHNGLGKKTRAKTGYRPSCFDEADTSEVDLLQHSWNSFRQGQKEPHCVAMIARSGHPRGDECPPTAV